MGLLSLILPFVLAPSAPSDVEAWAMRLANRVRELPSSREAEPQSEAVSANVRLSAAIRKHGPLPRLLLASALVDEFLGRYTEAADLAKQSGLDKEALRRIGAKSQVAAQLRDQLAPNEVLLVEPLRLKGGGRVWAVVVGRPFLQGDDLYTANYVVDRHTKIFPPDFMHDPEARSGFQLSIYSEKEGTLRKSIGLSIAPESDPISETALYKKDLDGDGNEEAVVSCLYYGASWIPTTYAVAGCYKDKWHIDQTYTLELPGTILDSDRDGCMEIVGQQNIGDMGKFGHASQPRYPVAYRWETGKLVNADAHIKHLLRKYLADSSKAELISKDDVEIVGCKARALKILGKRKEALAYYKRAAKLNKARAKRLWDGMTPLEALETQH